MAAGDHAAGLDVLAGLRLEAFAGRVCELRGGCRHTLASGPDPVNAPQPLLMPHKLRASNDGCGLTDCKFNSGHGLRAWACSIDMVHSRGAVAEQGVRTYCQR